eukprot:1136864-Pelagomonas_calceolata.AAC.19
MSKGRAVGCTLKMEALDGGATAVPVPRFSRHHGFSCCCFKLELWLRSCPLSTACAPLKAARWLQKPWHLPSWMAVGGRNRSPLPKAIGYKTMTPSFFDGCLWGSCPYKQQGGFKNRDTLII